MMLWVFSKYTKRSHNFFIFLENEISYMSQIKNGRSSILGQQSAVIKALIKYSFHVGMVPFST